MTEKGGSLVEFMMSVPFTFTLIFFLMGGVIFLGEKFLLKYAIYVETRKLVPSQEEISFYEKKRVEETLLRMLSFLPFRKKIISLKINQSEEEVSLRARLYYYSPISIIDYFLNFNFEEACVLKK